jgi:hypothetical protein
VAAPIKRVYFQAYSPPRRSRPFRPQIMPSPLRRPARIATVRALTVVKVFHDRRGEPII